MKRIRKWLTGMGIVLLVIVIVLAGVGTWVVRRPWPQVSGRIEVPGLLAPVEVIRDQWGVPHIYAQNEHDLFFAQGYVHAQDRLWQMEMSRRLCNGTLSEILGEIGVGTDLCYRTIGTRRVIEQSWLELDSDSRTILESYIEGVNAYIETHHNRLPLEFAILGVDPEPWTPVDALMWDSLITWDMGLNSLEELIRVQILARLGEDAARQLVPVDDLYENTPLIVPMEESSYDRSRYTEFEDLTSGSDRASVWGSNNWVVHGDRTATGVPMLANDIHANLPMPSLWYENGLHGGRFDSVGFTFPGLPLILIGHNQRIAWGVTNLDSDIEDIYIERLDDVENPKKYEFMGEWYDLDVVHETIEVKGGEPVEAEILFTRHGPLVNNVFPMVTVEGSRAIADAEPMSIRRIGEDSCGAFGALRQLNLASNWNEFRAALQYWDALGENFVYVDVEGNIGYQAAGKIPIRAPGHQGTAPVPGWTGKYEWQGFIPFDELPSILNPPEGFIATANNKVTADDYPYPLTPDWLAPGYRAAQITDLLSTTKSKFDIEDMKDIQRLTYSIPAEILRPYLVSVDPEDDLQAEALARVEAWDLCYETDSVGASIFATWRFLLIQNMVGDELQKNLMNQYIYFWHKHTPMIIRAMADADNAWFDDVNTPEVETRDDIVQYSFAEAIDWLSEQYGEDPSNWKWGRMHTVSSYHVPFGLSGIPLLERIFNGKRVAVPGDQFTVNTGRYFDQQYEVEFGTVLRMIIDLSDWDNSLAINSTGQSEHLFHPHRGDQISLWQNVEYRPMLFSREAVEKNAEAVLTLTPQQ